MKRHLIAALVIGFIAGGLIIGLHVSGWLLRPEMAIADMVSNAGEITTTVPAGWQYVIVLLLAMGVAWATLAMEQRLRMGWIVGGLLVELLGVAWICGLFHASFQPLPAMGAAILGF